MGILTKLFGNKKLDQIPILRAIVRIDNEDNANVEFKKLHPDLQSPEYIRMMIHYYAKVLVILDPNQPESEYAYAFLMNATSRIVNTEVNSHSDLINICEIDDVLKYSIVAETSSKFDITLYSMSGILRHITTEIPSGGFVQDLAHSVIVLMNGGIRNLDMREIQVFQNSLQFMNTEYMSGTDFRDLINWEQVPINAYLDSIIN